MKKVAGHKLYLDTNLFIYAVEEVEPWADVVEQLLNAIDTGECSAATSELSVAECLVKPLELNRADLVQTYLDFLQTRRFFTVVPVTRDILIEAARLRTVAHLRLPDAIHAATALRLGYSSFLTNDQRFKAVPAMQTLLLEDLQEK